MSLGYLVMGAVLLRPTEPGGRAVVNRPGPSRAAVTLADDLPRPTIGPRVTAPLAYALMAVGLSLAAWTGLWANRRKPVNAGQIITALVLEAALLVQSVIAVVRLAGDATVAEPVTFVAYAAGILVPLALGVYLARIERPAGARSHCVSPRSSSR